MLLSKLTADCLKYLDSTGKSPHTLSSYEIAFRQFVSFITGHLRLTDDAKHLTEEHVMQFQVALREHGMNANSIRARLSAIARLVKYGATRKTGRGQPVIDHTAMMNVERPKKRRPQEKWLQDAEIAAYFAVPCHPRLAIIREVLFDLGLRASEMVAATWGSLDVDSASGLVCLSVTVKGGHHARIPLSPEVAEHLHDYYLSRGAPATDQPMFVDARGKALTRGTLSYITRWFGTRAGITRFKTAPHSIRHTVNVIRRRAGLDSTTRSALLTHTNPSSIVSYEHVEGAELVAARAEQRRQLQSILTKSVPRDNEQSPRKLWAPRPALEQSRQENQEDKS
jgi:site-specific recombinase XerD